MAREDGALVEEVLNGGQMAFQELVCRHGPSILALARSFLGDHAESEDVTQETFMAAYQGLAELKEPERFAPWLYQIGRNLCRRRLGVESRRPALQALGSAELEQVTERPLGRGRNSGDVAGWGEASPALAALDSLPQDYALVIRLRHLEGLDLARIAELCDLSVSGVNTRLYRGRKLLREKLMGLDR